jgi:ABC-2 type transport system ATP-binding protein
MAALLADQLVKRYRRAVALDHVSLSLEAGVVHGLFGHNGAGKTTLMSLASAHLRPTSGTVQIFGQDPYEHAHILERLCFIREGQAYPNELRPAEALDVARLFYPRWDTAVANYLVEALAIPMKTRVRRLSRGQNSAVGVTIGIASRADITFFDEPYLGLDAVARQVFYETLSASYQRDPRTIILSSHLIDEVADLVTNVVVLDHGRVLVDQEKSDLLERAARVVGTAEEVERFVAGREVIDRQALGPYLAATIICQLTARDRALLEGAALTVEPVSLQQLVIHLSRRAALAPGALPPRPTGGEAQTGPDAPGPQAPQGRRRPNALSELNAVSEPKSEGERKP